ncbi:MAG: hypothetical protein K6G01_00030 [Eubacterium sp.]|nr:hypothetical protein [Eubacterium sp.]
MSTLYIHIGTPKTGTTSIQHFMSINADALKMQGAIYPDLGKKEYLVSAQRNGHWLCNVHTDPLMLTEQLSYINELSYDYDKIILSDEGIWNYSARRPAFWKNVIRAIEQYNYDLKVIVYLRRQDEYAYSHYVQQVQTRRDYNYTLSEYLSSCLKGKKNFTDYDAYLTRLSSVIGKDHVIVRPYERSEFKNGSIISDFLEVLGLTLTDDFAKARLKNNPSIVDVLVEAKRCLNSVPLYQNKGRGISKWLYDVQSELKDEGLLHNRTGFTKSNRASFLAHYTQGNQHVAREYLGREDGRLFLHEEISDDDEPAQFDPKELERIYDALYVYNANRKKPLIPPDTWRQILDAAMQTHLDEQQNKFVKFFRENVKRMKRHLGHTS